MIKFDGLFAKFTVGESQERIKGKMISKINLKKSLK